mmetsp:Transcript_46335/g.110312  ORF Transcript_46335/g.110312 Transcript_46335/m.110312 type:complete len:230 (+) Transcript_46335:1248-1937(+)
MVLNLVVIQKEIHIIVLLLIEVVPKGTGFDGTTENGHQGLCCWATICHHLGVAEVVHGENLLCRRPRGGKSMQQVAAESLALGRDSYVFVRVGCPRLEARARTAVLDRMLHTSQELLVLGLVGILAEEEQVDYDAHGPYISLIVIGIRASCAQHLWRCERKLRFRSPDGVLRFVQRFHIPLALGGAEARELQVQVGAIEEEVFRSNGKVHDVKAMQVAKCFKSLLEGFG